MYGNPQYYDPNIQAQYQQRMAQLAQQYPQFANQVGYGYPQTQAASPQGAQQPVQQTQASYLNGRPVTSIEEARGIPVPLDGSMIIMPCTSKKQIFTRQMDGEGNAPVLTYILDETPPVEPEPPKEYAEKAEITALNNMILALQSEITTLKGALSNGDNATASNGKERSKSNGNDSTATTE